jgi:chromatin remodeling complex protein RSC6
VFIIKHIYKMESQASFEIKADASASVEIKKTDASASVEIKKADASADASASVDLPTQFNNLNQIINIFKTQLNDIQNQVKAIEKNVKKEMKNSQQQSQAKEVKKSTSIPIGFAKPVKVSAELCIFMNRPVGSEISRVDATQYLLKYIREHKLQEMNERKKINPDETLSKLLGRGFRPPTTTEEGGEAGFERAEPLGFERAHPLTYYNLQTYLNDHFI